METEPFDISSYDTVEPIDTTALADAFYTDASIAHDDYAALSDISWDLWDAATEAWLSGDTDAAYALTTASIEADALSDQSWDIWNDSFATAQDLEYSDHSYASTGYDASWSAAADTSSTWSAAADTSSSWSAAADTSSSWSASVE